MRKYLSVSTPALSLWTFVVLQHIVIGLFLLTRNPNRGGIGLSTDIYLTAVGISTLVLAIFLAIQLVVYNKVVQVDNLLIPAVFVLPMISLYFSMFVNDDLKTALGLTFLVIFIAPFVFWISNQDSVATEKQLNLIVLSIAVSSLIFSLLQVFELVPVAQSNLRESLIISGNRPTGIFFNAFSLSVATLMTYLIGLNNILLKRETFKSWFIIASSIFTLFLAATRTSLFLAVVLTFLLVFQKTFTDFKKAAFAGFSTVLVGVGLPFLSIPYGNFVGNNDLATLNGRTILWSCVLERSSEFVPFGIGVEAAFTQGFCVQEGWFSRIRHPENMFLLSFVEAGYLGIFSYLILFTFTFWLGIKALKSGHALSLALTTTVFMSSIISVSLFHYVPFLTDRTADRGVFNFYLMIFIWFLYVLLGQYRTKNLSTIN